MDTVSLCNQPTQGALICAFYRTYFVDRANIVGQFLQPGQLLQIRRPFLSQMLMQKRCQRWVSLLHPAARRDAVGLVNEFFRRDKIKSGTRFFLINSECSFATPLTRWLPTIARLAIRIFCRFRP